MLKEDTRKSQEPNDNCLGWLVQFPIRPLVNLFEGVYINVQRSCKTFRLTCEHKWPPIHPRHYFMVRAVTAPNTGLLGILSFLGRGTFLIFLNLRIYLHYYNRNVKSTISWLITLVVVVLQLLDMIDNLKMVQPYSQPLIQFRYPTEWIWLYENFGIG